MPDLLHERKESKVLFETLSNEMNLAPVVIEKDYWVMHCLWGLQQNKMKFELKGGTSLSKGWKCINRFSEDIDIRFECQEGLNIKGKKQAHIQSRLNFFDELAGRIKIPGITVRRNRVYDDVRAQNGGIGLIYKSHFLKIPDLNPEVLLEVGFANTAPNEPRDITSWAIDKIRQSNIKVFDNRAMAVKCFNPEYTFVEKLQTICKKYRQRQDRNSPEYDQPKQFLRHYYDLYKLLNLKRVRDFIESSDYVKYKEKKVRGRDKIIFDTLEPFTIQDTDTYQLFEKEYEFMKILLLADDLSFKEIMRSLRTWSSKF